VLEQLVAGRVVTYEVVLPEGLTAAEIAARLEAATLVRADEFLAVARDPAVAREFEVEGSGLEGISSPRPIACPRPHAKQVARCWSISSAPVAPLEADARARGLASSRS